MSQMTADYVMPPSAPALKPARAATIAGWVIGGLPTLGLLAGGVIDVLKLDFAAREMAKGGYPAHIMVPLGVATVLSVALYLVPQTAVLGAILLTGYLGGAVCHHVHAGDPAGNLIPAFVFASLLWGGLLLREPRLRALLPLRKM